MCDNVGDISNCWTVLIVVNDLSSFVVDGSCISICFILFWSVKTFLSRFIHCSYFNIVGYFLAVLDGFIFNSSAIYMPRFIVIGSLDFCKKEYKKFYSFLLFAIFTYLCIYGIRQIAVRYNFYFFYTCLFLFLFYLATTYSKINLFIFLVQSVRWKSYVPYI